MTPRSAVVRSLIALACLLLALAARAQTYSVITVADATGAPLRFSRLRAIVAESDGSLVLLEGSRVARLLPSGMIVPIAGTPGASGTVDGQGTAARFPDTEEMAMARAPDGTLYVSQSSNHVIRRIDPSGMVTTFAGSTILGETSYRDGTGSAARFYKPKGLAVDAAGNLFVMDSGNGLLRRITPAGVVTTFAGAYTYAREPVDGVGAEARFTPFTEQLTIDHEGNLYATDRSSYTIRKITPSARVSTLAGRYASWQVADGPGAEAMFLDLKGIAVDAEGTLFITDQSMLRRISAGGVVTTIAGQNGISGATDGLGGNARFSYPTNPFFTPSGDLCVINSATTLRRISPIARPAPPILLMHPGPTLGQSSQVVHVTAGMTLTLEVKATGSAPLTYVWDRNGIRIPDQTGPILNRTVTAEDGGQYRVTISNEAGSVTSHPVTVTNHITALSTFVPRHSASGGSFLWGIAAGVDQLVAVGTGGTILTSRDGQMWTRRNSGTTDWLVGITYAAGRFVVVGDRGTILVSTDGIAWTPVASTTSQRLNGVAHGKHGFVAVGEGGTVARSTDGLTWRLGNSGVTTWLRGIVYTPLVPVGFPPDRPNHTSFADNGTDRYFASGQNGVLLWSTDGGFWSPSDGGGHRFDTNKNNWDIETLAAGPYGIGQSGLTVYRAERWGYIGNQIQSYSYVKWTWDYSNVGLPGRFRGLMRGGGAFFATGENGVIATAPGISGPWVTLRSPTTANLVSGVFRGNTLFIVGENETILESEPLYTSRLGNLSTRGSVASGDVAMISGFVVSGSSPKRILLRAAGPALAAFGVRDAVAAPTLEVFDSERRPLASNRGWSAAGNAAEIAATAGRVGAFPFAAGSADAALLLTLEPGAYTMQVSGAGSAPGTSLVEAYDADAPSNTGSRAINISTRGRVSSDGDRLIAGFVISGVSSRRVLIRAIGPSLASFGLSSTLEEPQLELYGKDNQLLKRGGAWIAEPSPDAVRQAAVLTGAFALDDTRADAAFVTELPPGSYTVQVSGLNGSTGLALVEVYDLP